MITVLSGGVGGSRFLRALTSITDPARITAIINTGDDDWFHGLYVSPDPDIVTYALAGEVDEERGWGLRGDTFRWLDALPRFGGDTWFRIGDRDLATHLHRTRLLGEGSRLSAIVADIARAFGVTTTLLPMSDDPVRTIVSTDAGDLPFQQYLVQHHARHPVRAVRFEGVEAAKPAPGVLDAIRQAEAIFIAPSNPIGSIAPILAVPGIRDAVETSRARRAAVSPIIAGASLQPPAAEMMRGLGHDVSVDGVAAIYTGLIDALIVDEEDADRAGALARRDMRCVVARTRMIDDRARRDLGAVALESVGLTP